MNRVVVENIEQVNTDNPVNIDLDLLPNTVIQTTIKSIEIGNITSRFLSFTNSLKFPATEKNLRAYGNSQLNGSISLVPYKRRSIKLVQNGIEVIPNGTEQVKSIGDFIETTIYSSALDFFERIKDKMIYEVDLSSLNDEWNDSTIGNFCNTTTGVVAPAIDYGDYNSLTNDINTGSYLPSIYYHNIIQAIFRGAGYSYSGSIFSQDRYLKLIQPFSRDKFEYAKGLVERFFFVAQNDLNSYAGGTNPTNVTITFPTEISDPSNNFSGNVFNGGFTGSLGFNFHFFADIPFFVSGPGTNFTVEIFVDGVVVASVSGLSASQQIFLDSRILFPDGVTMGGGSTARVRVTGTNTNVSGFTAGGKFYNEPVLIPVTSSGSSRQVNFSYLLPEYKQSEYIKDFFNRFGLIPYENNGTIILKSISEIISETFNALDFSAKLVKKQNKILFTPLVYGYTNNFKYQTPSEVSEKTLGQGSFTLSNFTYLSNKDIYNSFFNATNTTNIGFLFCASIPIYKRNGLINTVSIFNAGSGYTNGNYPNQALTGGIGKDATADITVSGGVITVVTIKQRGTDYRLNDRLSAAIPGGSNLSIQVTKTDFANRLKFDNEPKVRLLMLRDKRVNEPNILYNGVSKSAYKVAYFEDSSETSDCSFQKSIDTDYTLFVSALNFAKLEKKAYNLNELDISKITPHTLIFDTNAYYLINSLKFISGKISEVELFKVG